MSGRGRFAVPVELLDQVADEAARVMAEHGIRDFALAKRKAAERLGLGARGALPSNAQIQERLAARQRLFEPDVHDPPIAQLRRGARGALGGVGGCPPRAAPAPVLV